MVKILPIPLYTSHNNFANLFYKEGYLNIKLSCFLDEYLLSQSYTKHNITNVVFANEKNNH